eukprot:scaffold925_cov129-Cylindrotheca_fusiformis.AAC.14
MVLNQNTETERAPHTVQYQFCAVVYARLGRDERREQWTASELVCSYLSSHLNKAANSTKLDAKLMSQFLSTVPFHSADAEVNGRGLVALGGI